VPWIYGTMDSLHGNIDIWYKVKGSKTSGKVFFRSAREGGRMGVMRTTRWELELDDGTKDDLLVDESRAPGVL